jgi:hypothetical protein
MYQSRVAPSCTIPEPHPAHPDRFALTIAQGFVRRPNAPGQLTQTSTRRQQNSLNLSSKTPLIASLFQHFAPNPGSGFYFKSLSMAIGHATESSDSRIHDGIF